MVSLSTPDPVFSAGSNATVGSSVVGGTVVGCSVVGSAQVVFRSLRARRAF